jgi:hypothetical protein
MKRTTTKPASTALVRTPRSIKRAAARIAPLHLKQILVPVDFSTFSGRALRHALPMAQRFGAQIVLLHVIELFPIDYMVGTESDTITGVEGRRRAKDDLAKLGAKILESSGVPYRSVVRAGKPYREIVKAARELDADMLSSRHMAARDSNGLILAARRNESCATRPVPCWWCASGDLRSTAARRRAPSQHRRRPRWNCAMKPTPITSLRRKNHDGSAESDG